MKLTNLMLPGHDTKITFDVEVCDASNKILSIKEAVGHNEGSPPSRVIPPLCHPHVHLDKPFLLNAHNEGEHLPDYSDLVLKDGSFSEALTNTSKAKERYTNADLLLRGSQLIIESVRAGVTSMRAFVEVDHVTKLKCVDAGVELKQKFKEHCHIQLCVFAQDPVISPDKNGPRNQELVEEALKRHRNHIEVIGSTPYVESSDAEQRKNIDWAIKKALEYKLHLDFHLDYNLDAGKQAMVWYVVEALAESDWSCKNPNRTVVIGHCSRMTLFSDSDMLLLAGKIRDSGLPIHFVGLPSSDILMMGRPSGEEWGGSRQRGTLQVLELVRRFKLKACIGINNVGNAFTPWGNVDPLRLASLGVGIYQAGTPQDAELLFECISALAQEAIGLEKLVVRSLEEGANASFVIVKNDAMLQLAGISVKARKRLTVADIVWDCPEISYRQIVGRPAS